MKTNRRTVRIERRNARRAAKANAQLILCRQAGEFHKEYLEVEYAVEEAKLAELQARIDALQPAQTEVVVTEEEVDEIIRVVKESVGRLRAMSPIYPGN